MDGTLCRFHDTEHRYIEAMWTQGFYRDLKPFEEFLNGLSVCMERNKDAEFFILSAMLDTEPPFVEGEKREWLHTYLPQLKDEQMIFIPAGHDKSEYVGEIGADCCLIDDYNKNLNEWQNAGGTAVKFINDVNNRGLGAYGGEKGKLWGGPSIRYDQSSMDICLQIEQLCGIERQGEKATARYGFEGDVLPWDFAATIVPYFELRAQHDYDLIAESQRRGNTFTEYGESKSQAARLTDRIYSYMQREYNADKALVNCLEQCYIGCRVHNISADRISGWVAASVKRDNMWRTYPVTPSNVQMYITLMLNRDERLAQLNRGITEAGRKLMSCESALFMPNQSDIVKSFLTDGERDKYLNKERADLRNKLGDMKAEWQNLAKAEYPKLAFGNAERSYSSYTKNHPYRQAGK